MLARDYIKLKAAGAVTLASVKGQATLSTKRFDTYTGLALADTVRKFDIVDVEQEKERLLKDIERLQDELADADAMIADLHALVK